MGSCASSRDLWKRRHRASWQCLPKGKSEIFLAEGLASFLRVPSMEGAQGQLSSPAQAESLDPDESGTGGDIFQEVWEGLGKDARWRDNSKFTSLQRGDSSAIPPALSASAGLSPREVSPGEVHLPQTPGSFPTPT